ncbi:MAG: ABC transporter substrate-binding protein [Chloroflexi bacterium]|nr:ABC transporter substrate-binding protein [Chloroflexota bacterium]
MLPRPSFRSFLVIAALGVAALFILAACENGGAPPAGTPSPGASATPAGLYICTPPETGTSLPNIPELEDGVLNVGSDIAYAPIESYDEDNNPVGVDIDLGNCIAADLGVEVDYANLGFDPLIPSIRGGEIDAILSGMTIKPGREKKIDFIPYFTSGTGILVAAGNPEGVQSVEDLCGLTAAVQLGTTQVDQLEALNGDTCADDNVTIQTFDENPLAVEQLRVGAADANLADYPVVLNDALLSEGELEVAGEQFESAPYGIGVRKGAAELNDAITQALINIINDGRYDQILAKWGAEAGAYKVVAAGQE